jgi:uncharacterized Zn finger protein
MGWGKGGYGDFGEYESVAEKRARAAKRLAKLRKENPHIAPIIIEGRTIARSWWAKAWIRNLESYADYANRIDRGKSYLRYGMVLDLIIEENMVNALVMGSGAKTYGVQVRIEPLSDARVAEIARFCGNRITSTAQLAEGTFPQEFGERFLDQKQGLFPSPREIHFSCTCPDYAYMCKHVAAVLYGIGARFDDDPLLFFKLRSIPTEDLIKRSVDMKMESMLKNARKKTPRTLRDEDINELFGL